MNVTSEMVVTYETCEMGVKVVMVVINVNGVAALEVYVQYVLDVWAE